MSTANATAVRVTGIDVHTYLAKDPKRAIEFYRDIIGLPISVKMDQGAEFDLADGSTFGVWCMHDGSWHPSAGVMFAVPSVKDAVALYRQRGVKIVTDTMELDHCDMALCEDSEGNSFILHHRKH